jgi:surface carbohydrate biosynthesis protein
MHRRINTSVDPVILLVDSKIRDLDVAALIAFHLRGLGIACYLEPLEAFRAVLAAYRPGMVIFNHMTASHLVAWSKKLADMGVLTSVLLNEGIAYDKNELAYNAGRHHVDAHVDYWFCWNEPSRQALAELGVENRTKIEVIGVPRFDFYFEPWSHVFEARKSPRTGRPQILFCTNFQTARFAELPREEGDKFFAPWVGRIPLGENYWRSIEAHHKGRERALDYLNELLLGDKFEIILRPHPREDRHFYTDWIAKLPDERRRNLRIDTASNISKLILECDLEISCETCTTAIESWIAGKPTIELILERDPFWYREEHAQNNIPCNDPKKLPELVEQQLRNPAQSEKTEIRRHHVEKWCSSPDGNSSLRLARIIANAVREKKATDWSKLDLNDYRRAAKLFAFHKLGLAYHFDPTLLVKRAIFPKRYAIKSYVYRKSIKPRDVFNAEQLFERLGNKLAGSSSEKNAA